MINPLGPCWTRLDWGITHLDSLHRTFNDALDYETHPLSHDGKAERHGPDFEEWVWRFVDVPVIPFQCSLIIGDALHCFRSTLDHLAWLLVRRVGTMPSDPRLKERIQFPMAKSYANFRSQLQGKGSRLPGVPERPYIALIRRYQPYRRDKAASAMRLLNRLANTDKHREVIPTLVTSLAHEVSLSAPGWIILDSTHHITRQRAVKEGTQFLTAKLRPDPDWSTHPKPVVNGELRVYPSFGHAIAVQESMALIAQTVLEILAQAEALLS